MVYHVNIPMIAEGIGVKKCVALLLCAVLGLGLGACKQDPKTLNPPCSAATEHPIDQKPDGGLQSFGCSDRVNEELRSSIKRLCDSLHDLLD